MPATVNHSHYWEMVGIGALAVGVMNPASRQCASYVLATFTNIFADRSLFGVHYYTSETTYFHSKPTQISPQPMHPSDG